jgi:hypothetical protein
VVSYYPSNIIILCFCGIGSASKLRAAVTGSCISRPVGLHSFQLEAFISAVVKLQRWWKGLLLLKLRIRSAIIIQSCTRGWIARRKATVETHRINVMEVWFSICYHHAILFVKNIVIYNSAILLFVCFLAGGNLSELIYLYWFEDVVTYWNFNRIRCVISIWCTMVYHYKSETEKIDV